MKRLLKLALALALVAVPLAVVPPAALAGGPYTSTFTYCGDYSHGAVRVCVDPNTAFGPYLYVYGDAATPTVYTASGPVQMTTGIGGVGYDWVTTPPDVSQHTGGLGIQWVTSLGLSFNGFGYSNVTVCIAAPSLYNPPAGCNPLNTKLQIDITNGFSYHGGSGTLAQVWSEVWYAIGQGGNFQTAS